MPVEGIDKKVAMSVLNVVMNAMRKAVLGKAVHAL
jgi:hypothetical protein